MVVGGDVVVQLGTVADTVAGGGITGLGEGVGVERLT